MKVLTSKEDINIANSLYDFYKDEDRIKAYYRALKEANPSVDEKTIINLVKYDLKQEDDELAAVLDKAYKTGKLTIYRAMLIDNICVFIDILKQKAGVCGKFTGIGDSWAWDFDHAEVYDTFSAPKGKRTIVILQASVKFKDIDLGLTEDLHFTMHENEIKVFIGRTVMLNAILDKEKNIIKKFSPSIPVIA